VYSKTQIDPVVSFRNSQGELVRGTIINLQRKSLVMEVYNPYSIVQVSEVLSELSVKMGTEHAYSGKAVVISMVNTGLTAIVSVTLIDEWRELSGGVLEARAVGEEARFAHEWAERFQIRRDYQIAVNQLRAFLTDMSRWVEQADLADTLPKEGKSLREDFFLELASPLMQRTKVYFDEFEGEARLVDEELAPAHRAFARPRSIRCCCARPSCSAPSRSRSVTRATIRWSTRCSTIRARVRARISRSSTRPSCKRPWRARIATASTCWSITSRVSPTRRAPRSGRSAC
jgi:hypothetical protein